MKHDILGTWTLLDYVLIREDGVLKKPWGDDVTGLLIYSPDGYMSANLMPTARTVSPTDATASESKLHRAARYIAYAGTYTAEAHTITHHVEVSLFPVWIGLPQVRYYEVTDDRLTLRTPPIPRQDKHLVGQLVWTRAR